MPGAAVGEVVAVDRGDDDVGEAHLGHRTRHALRLAAIERGGDAGGDVAERAGAGADLAHDHEGGVLLFPALADIGAARLLADGDQAMRLDDLAGLGVAGGPRRAHADPVRLLEHGLVGAMRLFRMAWPGDGVEQRNHLDWTSAQARALVRPKTHRMRIAPAAATIRLPRKP